MYLPSPRIKGPSILIVFSIKVHSSEWSKYFAALWNNIVFKMNISVCTPEYPTNYVTSNTENKGFSLSLGGSYARAAAPQYHRPLDRVLWVVLCSSGTAASAQSSWWSWPSSGRQAWSEHHILTLLILSCLLQSVPPAHLVIAVSLLDLRNVQLYNMWNK